MGIDLEGSLRLFEFVRVFVQGVVGQVHVEVAQVHAVRLLVIVLMQIGKRSRALQTKIRKL